MIKKQYNILQHRKTVNHLWDIDVHVINSFAMIQDIILLITEETRQQKGFIESCVLRLSP